MFKEMCFEAERPGVIGEMPVDEWSQEFGAEDKPRPWTSDELAGMFIPDSPVFTFAVDCGAWYVSVDGRPIADADFDTLSEALLFAVMFEKGFLWENGEFKKREVKKVKDYKPLFTKTPVKCPMCNGTGNVWMQSISCGPSPCGHCNGTGIMYTTTYYEGAR